MKKFLLLFILYFCLYPVTGQWNEVANPSSIHINSIKYVNSVLYMLNADGVFFRSYNNGTTWFQNQPLSFQGRDIDFLSSGVGFASSANGIIAKTIDFGSSWNTQTLGANTGFNFVQMARENVNVVYTGGSLNPGSTGCVYKSTNGGTIWNPCSAPGFSVSCGAVVNQNTVIVGGTVSDEINGKISKTTDGGSTWNLTSLPNSGDVTSIFFFDSQTGWIGTETGNIYLTVDGGNNWNLLSSFARPVNSIVFKGFQNGWACVGSRIYYTANTGGNWTEQSTAGLNETDLYTITINDLDNRMAAGGTKGAFLPAAVLISANGGGALPISLSYFNGKPLNSTIKLSWQTASEQNNKGFDIERSDGSKWQSIGYINGKGNSSLPTDYTFVDEHPMQGDNLYRLKQTDFDGKFTYSQVLSLKADLKRPEFYVNNNPAHAQAIIGYTLLQSSTVNIDIINANGQPIRSVLKKTEAPGSYTLNTNTADLPRGVYWIRMITQNKKFTSKLLIE